MPETKHSSLGEINSEGDLMIYNKHLKEEFQQSNKSRTVRIDFSVIEGNPSNKMNAYYWVVIVPVYIRGFKETGLDIDAVQAHKEIRKLCPHMRMYDDKGKLYLRSLDDEDWTNNDWQELLRQAIQAAAEHFNIVINDPNQYEG